MNKAMLDAGAGRWQVARRHRDPHTGLAVDPVAQRCSIFDHRLERWNPESLGFGVGLGDKDIPPDPTVTEVLGDPILAVAGLAHCLAIQRRALPGLPPSIARSSGRDGPVARARASTAGPRRRG